MHREMVKYRIKTTARNHLHRKSIEKYFFDGNDEGVQVTPKTLAEGLQLWLQKVKRPNFETNKNSIKTEDITHWIIIDYEIYLKNFKTLPDCQNYRNFKIVFFKHSDGNTSEQVTKGCIVVTVSISQYSLKKLDVHFKLLMMLTYAVKHKATSITHLWKVNGNDQVSQDCIEKSYDFIRPSEKWREVTYHSDQYWYAWMPVNKQIASIWVSKILDLMKNNNKPNLKCFSFVEDNNSFSTDGLVSLKRYLKFWNGDEESNVFYKIDQLNFELSVRGFILKPNAEHYRYWLETLSANVL